MRFYAIIIAFILFCFQQSWAQPYFFRLDAGTGKHFEQVTANQAFADWGMEISQAPLIKLNTQIGYQKGKHQFSVGGNLVSLGSKFLFGPVFTQPYAKEYIRENVYATDLISFSGSYQYKFYKGKFGDISAHLSMVYTDNVTFYWGTEFPYHMNISGIRDGRVIESRTSTLYYRNADVGAELGLMYYPPLKTRRLRYYVRASYTHYFRPWGGYESDYYRIYDLNDPDVLLAEVEYSGTTYNRHVSLTIGFERQFGKKRYSRDQPF